MLKWEIGHDPLGKVSMSVSWDQADMIDIDLTPFDLMLLRECEVSTDFSDKLLAAELIVRKLESKQAKRLASEGG